MGRKTAKKAPAKGGRSPARERRSSSRSLKSDQKTAQPAEEPVEASQKAAYSHNLPTQEQRRGNGRHAGRSLIKWNRPKMAEKLLLHIHYECTRHKISLPWDTIAHRLHPGSSGAAIQQHFNRLRRELLSEGHLVPPLGNKPGAGTVDVETRGFVRVEDGNPGETRPVKFDETVDDPRFTIPDSSADDKEPIEDCIYASNSAPSHSQSGSPPTPMFGEMSQANMALRSVYGSQFDRAVAAGAAANTFPHGLKYSENLFPTEVVNAGLASGGVFHEVAPSSYLTPMRGERYFDAISPMDSPYLHMGGHTFSFAREPVELSPVELPGQSTAADTEVSLAQIIQTSIVPPPLYFPDETSVDSVADHTEPQNFDLTTMLMEDVVDLDFGIPGVNCGLDGFAT